MTTTTLPPSRVPTRERITTDLLAGAGALVFVALFVVQNAVRSGEPGFAASSHDLVAYFARHHTAGVIPLALYPVGMIGLLFFISGLRRRTVGGTDRFWADVGTFAAIVIAALFALVNVTEIAIVDRSSVLASSPAATQVLWGLHGGAFGLNLAAMALALVGLSRAALAQHLLPRWYGPIALVGAACLFTGSVFTVAITNGGAVLYVGFVGALTWAVFLVITGIGLLTRHDLSDEGV